MRSLRMSTMSLSRQRASVGRNRPLAHKPGGRPAVRADRPVRTGPRPFTTALAHGLRHEGTAMTTATRTYQVGYFVGSLSSTSINRVLSRALIRLAPVDLEFTEIPIGNLPLYSQDHDTDYPPEATALKA